MRILGTCLFLLIITVQCSKEKKESINTNKVLNFWSGSVQEHEAKITARFSNQGTAKILVSKDSIDFEKAFVSEKVLIQENTYFFGTFTIKNLESDTRYYYKFDIDGVLHSNSTGRFRTTNSKPYSYKIAFASCARTGSESKVFTTIKKEDPLLYIITGDLHYGDVNTDCSKQYAENIIKVLGSKTQQDLYRNVPIAYIWDDHDYGDSNSDKNAICREQAKEGYRLYVPSYPFAFKDKKMPLSQSLVIGRVRFLLPDLRSEKSPPEYDINCKKTKEGSNFGSKEHLDWFKQELLDAKKNNQVVVWVSGIPYINHPGGPNYECNEDDDWGGYPEERREIANYIKANKIQVSIISGDAHMSAIDNGTNSDYADKGGAPIPVFQAGPLDQKPSYKGGPYSHGHSATSGQFGIIEVTDNGGEEICFAWKAKDQNSKVVLNECGTPIAYEFCQSLVDEQNQNSL